MKETERCYFINFYIRQNTDRNKSKLDAIKLFLAFGVSYASILLAVIQFGIIYFPVSCVRNFIFSFYGSGLFQFKISTWSSESF
jgi:hypothetical protein